MNKLPLNSPTVTRRIAPGVSSQKVFPSSSVCAALERGALSCFDLIVAADVIVGVVEDLARFEAGSEVAEAAEGRLGMIDCSVVELQSRGRHRQPGKVVHKLMSSHVS